MILDSALDYARAGWAVFPVEARGKRPLTPQGFHDASTIEETLASWWAKWPEANVGAPVPPAFAVLDVDGETGEDTLVDLESRHGALPETLTCRTGGGGRHLYFRHPGLTLRQGAGLLGPGLDTRMPARGYVLLPPSVHLSGRAYQWADVETPAAPLPEWLMVTLRPPVRRRRHLRLVEGGDAYARAALRGEVEAVARAIEGQRNDRLNTAAFALGQLVGSGLLDEGHVADALLDAAIAAGLTETEAQATIRSGLRAGSVQPRGRTA